MPALRSAKQLYGERARHRPVLPHCFVIKRLNSRVRRCK
jgi:hypothetical protein